MKYGIHPKFDDISDILLYIRAAEFQPLAQGPAARLVCSMELRLPWRILTNFRLHRLQLQ
jgi:hypothetical protein